ncbi:unnamed protein product [Auanema sp. JU1783]|nr:unnamed protein product [Auanema sp. JU1783]
MNALLVSSYRQVKRDDFCVTKREYEELVEELLDVTCDEYRKRLAVYLTEVERLTSQSLGMIRDNLNFVQDLHSQYVPELKQDTYYDVALKNIEAEMEKMFKPFEEVKTFEFTSKPLNLRESKIIQNQIDLLEKEIKEKKEEVRMLKEIVEKEKSAYKGLKERSSNGKGQTDSK